MDRVRRSVPEARRSLTVILRGDGTFASPVLLRNGDGTFQSGVTY